ncbi:hypothetical protein F4678DRAFT_458341 [Xylaria arbuscula]|nr:hypothetical protein F4678DRAFT_458341 [Xylaria arbuscula]
MTDEKQIFWNLPAKPALDPAISNLPVFEKKLYNIQTNWSTFREAAVTSESVLQLLQNQIPVIREKEFLTQDECQRLLEITKSHKIGSYNLQNTWPRLGKVGVTHFDYLNDKDGYFEVALEARALQGRWKTEAGIDILQRVAEMLHGKTGLPVEVAREHDGREYFAGIVRASDAGIDVHADNALYETPEWSVGAIEGQLTWNILLNEVPGGETLIYDRLWEAPDDDIAWRTTQHSHTYQKEMLEGRPFKSFTSDSSSAIAFVRLSTVPGTSQSLALSS